MNTGFHTIKSRWWATPHSSWYMRSMWLTPLRTQQFRPISAHSASTVRASEKCLISTNRKSTTRFPTSHRWTVYVTPKSPKGGTKQDVDVLPVKFNFCRKEFAIKFLCVKTASDRVVATSFLYLMPDRCIAGDIPIYRIFALKVTHPFRKRRFWQISLNSASAVKASGISPVITNRKSTIRFPSSHRWTLCITFKSPNGWLKTRIFTFCVAFHIFVAGNLRRFKFGMPIDHS